jgi:HEAT repeat protein
VTDDPNNLAPDDAALDAVLAEAIWPEPNPASTRRLARFYRSQAYAPLARNWLIATCVLLAGGIAFFLLHRNPTQRIDIAQKETTPAAPAKTSPTVAGRAPTRLEIAQIVFAESETRRAAAIAARPDPVQQALAVLIDDQSDQAIAHAKSFLASVDPRRREAELARVIASSASPNSQAAADLIASMADDESIPLLMQMDRTPTTRDAAIRGLSRVALPSLLARLVRSHTAPEHRQSLIAGLFRTAEGIEIYLNLVSDRATSSDALAALDQVKTPPTDTFFAALSDPHISLRLAAAKVLGRIDGPQTTQRLVAMTERNQSRREALIALADSRGPEARQFLAEAGRAGPLAGTVRSILLEQLQGN